MYPSLFFLEKKIEKGNIIAAIIWRVQIILLTSYVKVGLYRLNYPKRRTQIRNHQKIKTEDGYNFTGLQCFVKHKKYRKRT